MKYQLSNTAEQRLTSNLDLAGPLGGPVQYDLLGGLQVGLVCPRLHVEDGPGGYKHAGGDNIERLLYLNIKTTHTCDFTSRRGTRISVTWR